MSPKEINGEAGSPGKPLSPAALYVMSSVWRPIGVKKENRPKQVLLFNISLLDLDSFCNDVLPPACEATGSK